MHRAGNIKSEGEFRMIPLIKMDMNQFFCLFGVLFFLNTLIWNDPICVCECSPVKVF